MMSIRAKASAFPASLALWGLLSGAAGLLLEVSLLVAIGWGLAAVVLHWGVAFLHQYGHAVAAWRVGYPMHHITAFGLLFSSVYPKDEDPLRPKLHIRRALGGPVASLLTSIGFGILLFFVEGSVRYLLLWGLLDAFLGFTIGAFIPLEWLGLETDGSTILKWRREL